MGEKTVSHLEKITNSTQKKSKLYKKLSKKHQLRKKNLIMRKKYWKNTSETHNKNRKRDPTFQ